MRSAIKYSNNKFLVSVDLTNSKLDIDSFSSQLGYVYETLGSEEEMQEQIRNNIISGKDKYINLDKIGLKMFDAKRNVLMAETTVEIDIEAKKANNVKLLEKGEKELKKYINNNPITNLTEELRKLMRV